MSPDGDGPLDATEFLPVLASNLLPLVGVLLLDWQFVTVIAVYWVEIAVTFVVYGVAGLFAQRPVVLDDREVYLPGVSRTAERRERWDREPDAVGLPGGLPSVYPRNARLVGLSLVWGFGMLAVVTLPVPALRAALGAGSVLLAAAAMTLSRLEDLRRGFFAKRRYEQLSVHQVLEIPGRLLVFAACYLAVVVVFGGGTVVGLALLAREAVGYTLPEGAYVLLFGASMVAGKIAVEWWRFRAENEAVPTGFAAWFRPEDPRATSGEPGRR